MIQSNLSNNILTNRFHKESFLVPDNQQGATLIAVLLFLILISVAGLMAVRQSSTDVKLATSDQINTLLLQSSDSANQQLESVVNSDVSNKEYRIILSKAGLFGHFILDADSVGDEYIYCFNSEDGRYLKKNATIKIVGEGFADTLGICNITNKSGYTSSRNAVVTQMSVTTKPTTSDYVPFDNVSLGEEVGAASSEKFIFDVRSTSVLPSYAKSTPEDCFEKTAIKANKGDDETVSECLANKEAPSKALYQRVELENTTTSVKCIDYGNETDVYGKTKVNTECKSLSKP